MAADDLLCVLKRDDHDSQNPKAIKKCGRPGKVGWGNGVGSGVGSHLARHATRYFPASSSD